MITLFTLPKPFDGHTDIVQCNAIQSWLHLRPACEVILLGDEPGIEDVAKQFGLLHLAHIPHNDYGTPYLDQAFDMTQAAAHNQRVAFVNTDIILFDDFLEAIQRLRFERFLMAGCRCNLDVDAALNFEDDRWDKNLQERARLEGSMQSPLGSDYFAFIKGSLGKLPPFVVGRPGWDNWMIYNARRSAIPVIDATRAVLAIHQNHGYEHVQERYDSNSYDGPESDYNLRIMEGNRQRFILLDATHVMTKDRLLPAWGPKYLVRRARTLAALHPTLRPLAEWVKRGVRQ
jgi:hypothetical protein